MQCLRKCKFIEVLLYISFLVLSIQAIFFMRGVMDLYVSQDTSLKQSEINITNYPTVTVCLKANVGFEYGSDFSISLRDLNLTLADDEYEKHDLEYDYLDDITLKYRLQKIHSYYFPTNSCYKIVQSGYKIITSEITSLRINFYGKGTHDNLPDIKVYFTSVKNSDGIIFSEWMDGDELKFTFSKVKPNSNTNIF